MRRGIVDGDTVRVWNHRGSRFWQGGRYRRVLGTALSVYSRRRMAGPEPATQAAYAKRRGKRPDKRSSISRLGNGCANFNTALRMPVLRKYTGRRYRLRRLIRLPTRQSRWGGGIPCGRYLQYENQAHGRSLRR